ncbi:hypothetical protein ACLB2K_022948 [Fragaria x ananassa]
MDSSDWANLPEDLLVPILERLPSALDYVRFSIVCRSWNSIAKKLLSKRSRLTGHPLLLTYTGKEETWNLCDVRNDKVFDLQLELPNKRFCGFSKGWLITMDEDFVVTLINPLSKVKGRKTKENSIIRLPALELLKADEKFRAKWTKFCDYYVVKATLSADPISNSKDCVVVVIHEDIRKMAFIRLEKDTSWTYIKEGVQDMEDVVYVKNKLYTVDVFDQLHYFAATTEPESFDISNITRSFKQQGMIKKYLVEVSGYKEPLMVKRYMYFEPDRGYNLIGRRMTQKFEVFRFDADGYKWTEINSIGDVALFVGDATTSVLASDFSGYLPNCIYFVHDWDRHRYHHGSRGPRNFGVYNISIKGFLKTGTTAASLMRMSNRTPIWITANIEL